MFIGGLFGLPVGCITMTDVKNAAYALSIALIVSTLIFSFSLIEASRNFGAASLARPLALTGGQQVVQPTAVVTVAATAIPTVAATAAPQVVRPTVDYSKAISKGSATAKVILVEYTDQQCPFCNRHQVQTEPSIVKDYVDTGKVRYVRKQFPLDSLHANARKAGEAVYCAQDQGKGFDFSDKIFVQQDKLAISDLKAVAKVMGLDSTKFDSCLDKGDKAAQVDADFNEGADNGVSGTPTSFVIKADGTAEKLVGALPFTSTTMQSFKTALDKAIAG